MITPSEVKQFLQENPQYKSTIQKHFAVDDMGYPLPGHKVYGLKRDQSGLPLTTFSKLSREYIVDMETRSGLKIKEAQRKVLKETLQSKKFEKLNSMEQIVHAKEYKPLKDAIIQQWEQNTGQIWPTYPKDIKQLNGTPHDLAGKRHQIHHIIPQEFGGPHAWWNAHPLAAGSAHQGGVHGAGSPLNQILKDAGK